jgi:hypothetical protein
MFNSKLTLLLLALLAGLAPQLTPMGGTLPPPIILDGSVHCVHAVSSPGSSVSCTLTGVTAGDLITVEYADRNGDKSSISDATNGTYSLATAYGNDTSDPSWSGIAYFCKAAAGTYSPTLNLSPSTDTWAIISAQAWRRAKGTSCLDSGSITQQKISTTNAANATCGSTQSPAGNYELVVGYAVFDSDASVTAGTNYTLIDTNASTTPNPVFPEYWIQKTGTATNGPFTSASDDWTDSCAAFLP